MFSLSGIRRWSRDLYATIVKIRSGPRRTNPRLGRLPFKIIPMAYIQIRSFYKTSRRALSLLIAFGLTACSPGFDLSKVSSVTPAPEQPSTPNEPVPDPGTPTTPPREYQLPRIAWETKSGARNWSLHAYRVILDKGASLLEGADDVVEYCPLYYRIIKEERAWFWTSLIAAMAYYESAWEPTARMHETTMGTDPVTGQPVYSEGLLQLSYQDRLGHAYCNEFDWNSDRHLSAKDPRKTILNPEKNLSCGIQILNRQIRKHRKIGIGKGAYWAVIKTTKPSNKIERIKARIKAEVPACYVESQSRS